MSTTETNKGKIPPRWRRLVGVVAAIYAGIPLLLNLVFRWQVNVATVPGPDTQAVVKPEDIYTSLGLSLKDLSTLAALFVGLTGIVLGVALYRVKYGKSQHTPH